MIIKTLATLSFVGLFAYVIDCTKKTDTSNVRSLQDVINSINKDIKDDIKKTDEIYQQLRLSTADKFTQEELSQIAKVNLSDELLALKRNNPDKCVTCIQTEDPNTWHQ